jgi:hypothetical protein
MMMVMVMIKMMVMIIKYDNDIIHEAVSVCPWQYISLQWVNSKGMNTARDVNALFRRTLLNLTCALLWFSILKFKNVKNIKCILI